MLNTATEHGGVAVPDSNVSSIPKPPTDWQILNALDLPRELHPIQNTYWEAKREFEKLQDATALVVRNWLDRNPQDD